MANRVDFRLRPEPGQYRNKILVRPILRAVDMGQFDMSTTILIDPEIKGTKGVVGIVGLEYEVFVYRTHIQVGCINKPTQWWVDLDILHDDEEATKWWMKHRDLILGVIEYV